MLINNIVGISSLAEFTKAETQPEAIEQNLDEILHVSRELTNWVKYLQITRDIHLTISAVLPKSQADTRKEIRYTLPSVYQEYMTLALHVDEKAFPATLLNFSSSGMQFRCSERVEENRIITCVLSTEHMVSKNIECKAQVKYVTKDEGGYIAGALIQEASNTSDFDFFVNVFDFIQDIETAEKRGVAVSL
jgi:hypothetical protein